MITETINPNKTTWRYYNRKFEYEELLQDFASSWAGHKRFAYDLVRNLKPSTIVELGTHWGTSFFSLCQGVKDAHYNARLYAVDTWRGDSHAGYYDDEVFKKVKKIKDQYYPGLNIELLRRTFDEALNLFENDSINLLHIDGFHTYEAVKHDFEAWLPKVKRNGIILFHDIFINRDDFGVYILWEELKQKYETIEFYHSYGLGVLFKEQSRGQLLIDREKEWQIHYSSIAEDKKNENTVDAIRTLERSMADRDAQLADRDAQLADRDAQLADRDAQLADRDAQLADRDAQLALILNSRSWRVTRSLRSITSVFWKIKRKYKIVQQLIKPYGFVGSFCRAASVMRNEGIAGVKWRILNILRLRLPTGHLSDGSLPHLAKTYSEWVELYDILDDNSRNLIRSRIDMMHRRPRISVIMPVYDPPCLFLEKAIMSIRNQLYTNWELCIADDFSKNEAVRTLIKKHADEDDRIKVVYRNENGHISAASNSALELATGEYISMFDHDDELPEHALYMIAEEINGHPDADFIYSDQDKISEDGIRFDPYFKPDFNPDLLRSQNYADHLAVFRTGLVKEVGGWRSEFDGSQDYDLVLRVVEKTTPLRIRHIPFVLYHWRALPGSLAIDSSAKNYASNKSRLALAESLKRQGINAKVTSEFPNLSIHRVIYAFQEEPLVTIIIPTKDGKDILSKCLDGILHHTAYSNYEIIIVDNQSVEPSTHEYLRFIEKDPRIRVLNYDREFNYSKINNYAAKEANGTVIAFLNNDIEVISSNWLNEMVSHAVRPDIGAVGARLYYPDDTVQHAGVLLGYKGKAGHRYRYARRHWLGHWARGVLIQNLTAVTAACMVVRKSLFETVGGFDEVNFTVTFNDVDLCIRIHEMGFRNLYTPYAELYHYESKTRGLHAFKKEEDYFEKKWGNILRNDPSYNPNLSLDEEDLSVAFPPRIIRPWIMRSKNFRTGDYPLVSIITRTHGNRRDFLKEAINSIFSQNYRPIELIIIEDGGNNARSLIEEIAVPDGVTIIYEPIPKHGRCFAGNRGLYLSKGEFFGFLDDDDLLLPNHLDELVKCLCNNACAPAAYSCSLEVPTDIVSLSPLKYDEKTERAVNRAMFSISGLWQYNFIPIQALLLRRELFEHFGGFFEELDCLEDWDLWLRYSVVGDFIFVDKITSKFRIPSAKTQLETRRNQHLEYLPVLRDRQQRLLQSYSNTPYYQRLKTAYESVKQ